MTTRTIWCRAWSEARRAYRNREEPDPGSLLGWTASLLLYASMAADRVICPADARPWRLP